LTQEQISLRAPLLNADLTIKQEAMGTMESVNAENSIENEY
jgi:hypothetical protein